MSWLKPPDPRAPTPLPASRQRQRLPAQVSIHVPCYNEPPEMVKQTLDALAALDYPDYEVIIIDNNTKDPAGSL